MSSNNLLKMSAIKYIEDLIGSGRKVGIFSCEDPYNTPFHRDVLNTHHYVHLVPKAPGVVAPESIDLGLQAKGINAWGIFGHYGLIHDHEVCAAIKALNNGHQNYGEHLRKHIRLLGEQYLYNSDMSLRDNVIGWIRTQYELLLRMIPEKQKLLKGAVQGDIIVFGGIIGNSSDGRSYTSEILFEKILPEKIHLQSK